MFVDVAKIRIKAGRGGDGHIGFHREKYVASGGPDGGDGGRGGNIVFTVDRHMSTLLDFRYKKKYAASDGEPGGTKRRFGKDGADTVIKVPLGTLIRDGETGALLHDMSDDEPFIAACGGRGGWGNAHFATPTRQAPRFAKPGLEGDERFIVLELKLIADVGLIGFPNVGKSTLLSMISAARPKIANYHFTTLQPNLGVVFISEGSSFVCADIPGIIEGAAEGAGLGHDFLRHIERCRLLVHLVDASGSEGRDPVEDLETINRELTHYSQELSRRPQIIVANKCDILEEGSDNLARLQKKADELGYPLLQMSAAAGQGVKELVYAVWNKLETLPPVEIFQPEMTLETMPDLTGERDIHIVRGDDAVFYVTGAWVERIVSSVNFDEYESRMYFERTLRKAGVFDMLEAKGIQEKDTVDVLGIQFEYVY
ncbi:MAG: GTPase ObgE [Clostridia bacterium]|nr:GTPase ObgE [Clostridia bacterium]